jgi:hypothetical protein
VVDGFRAVMAVVAGFKAQVIIIERHLQQKFPKGNNFTI